MARVPPTISSILLGGLMPAGEEPIPNLQRMSTTEIDRFIHQCTVALQSHERDFRAGHDKENALSAFESVLALLLEVRDLHPTRRGDIDLLLVQFGYPVPVS